MKKLVIISSMAIISLIIACSEKKATVKESPNPEAANVELSNSALIKRGQYLVTIMGCHDCHSPKIMTAKGPEPDPERLLSGHPANESLPKVDKKATQNWVLFSMGMTAIKRPWGMSFTANLTPDETCIGNWTLDNFKKAFREGKYKGLDGSRELLPPMPWQMFAATSDEDTKAIFTYLKSIKPIKNLVPAPKTPDQL